MEWWRLCTIAHTLTHTDADTIDSPPISLSFIMLNFSSPRSRLYRSILRRSNSKSPRNRRVLGKIKPSTSKMSSESERDVATSLIQLKGKNHCIFYLFFQFSWCMCVDTYSTMPDFHLKWFLFCFSVFQFYRLDFCCVYSSFSNFSLILLCFFTDSSIVLLQKRILVRSIREKGEGKVPMAQLVHLVN